MTKIAFITGGAKRIGAEIALKLANDGFDTIIHYFESAENAQQLQQQIQNMGRNCYLIRGDLRSVVEINDIINFVNNIISQNNCKLALLINNASLFLPDNINSVTWHGIHDHLNVNAIAPVMIIQKLYQSTMHIINILDAHSHLQSDNFFSYTMAKTALWRLTLDLAPVIAPNTRVNGIALGPTMCGVRQSQEHFDGAVKKSPLKIATSINEIYSAIQFLNHSPSITGEIINMDAGYAVGVRL